MGLPLQPRHFSICLVPPPAQASNLSPADEASRALVVKKASLWAAMAHPILGHIGF